MSKKNKRSKNKSGSGRVFRIAFISALVVFTLIGLVIVYGISLLDKMNLIDIPTTDEELGIKEDVFQDEKVLNIALLGIDRRHRDEQGRSDSIMIASLDKNTKKIKLTSIMRDTYVDIPGRGMDKINHAYAFGGPELTLRTINQNFDMNIREFAAVDFEGFRGIIDALGGIEIDVKSYEVRHIPGAHEGLQKLDGNQALAYTRIRKSGDGDYERTERQRLVLEKLIHMGIEAGVTQYPKLLNAVLPFVDTSLSKGETLSLGTSTLTAGINKVEQYRVPIDNYAQGQMINGVYYLVPQTLEDNVHFLHQFIYDDIKN